MWISRDNVRRDLETKTSGVQPAQGFPAACSWAGGLVVVGHIQKGAFSLTQMPLVWAKLVHLLLVYWSCAVAL